MKQAKIALTADIRGFKAQMDEARKAVQKVGQVKVDPEAAKWMRELQRDVNKHNRQVNRPGGPGGGSNDPKRVGAEIGQTLKSALGPILGGLTLFALFNRAKQMADENLKIRQLTRDGGTISGMSRYGFTPAERRANAAAFAGKAGGISSGGLTQITNMGEQIERAYGVSAGDSAGLFGASRKSGGAANGKFLSSVIGAAVATGLEGSKIGDYLRGMTSALETMSQGIDIDGSSLNGFAAALGNMPFFKNDPARMFNAINSLNNVFKGGDRFQQGMSTRAILAGAPGGSVASTEFRRSMGLFGNIDDKTMGNLRKAGVSTNVLGTGGADIIKNIFDEIMSTTKGMSADDQLFAFKQRTGMDSGAAASIFGTLANGGKIDANKLRDATMTPDQRLEKTFNNVDGSVKDMGAKLDQLIDLISHELIPPLLNLVKMMSKWLGDQGIVDNMNDAAGLAGAGIAGVAGAKGMGFAGKLAGKAAPRVMGAAGAKLAGRAIPGIGALVGAGYTVSDTIDLAGKYYKGENVTATDWAKPALSAAGMIPGIGLPAVGARTAIDIKEGLSNSSKGSGIRIPSQGGGPSLPVTSSPSGGLATENLAAVIQRNTEATERNTAVSGGRGSMGGAMPNYGRPTSRAAVATGKR